MNADLTPWELAGDTEDAAPEMRRGEHALGVILVSLAVFAAVIALVIL